MYASLAILLNMLLCKSSMLLRHIFMMVIVLAFSRNDQVLAQGKSLELTAIWISGGIGESSATENDFSKAVGRGSLRTSVTAQYEYLAFTIRYTYNLSGDLKYSPGLSFGSASERFTDIGALVGYVLSGKRRPFQRIILSAGIASVRGVRARAENLPPDMFNPTPYIRGFYEPYGPVLGIPVEIGLYTGKRWIGIGLIAHGNMSTERFFWALTLNLIVGQLYVER